MVKGVCLLISASQCASSRHCARSCAAPTTAQVNLVLFLDLVRARCLGYSGEEQWHLIVFMKLQYGYSGFQLQSVTCWSIKSFLGKNNRSVRYPYSPFLTHFIAFGGCTAKADGSEDDPCSPFSAISPRHIWTAVPFSTKHSSITPTLDDYLK